MSVPNMPLVCKTRPSRTSLRRWPHLVRHGISNQKTHHKTTCIQRAEDHVGCRHRIQQTSTRHASLSVSLSKSAFPEAALSRSRWRRAISSCFTVLEHKVAQGF